MNRFNYSLTELENMIPWERDIYVALLADYLKNKKEELLIEKQAEKHRR